MHVTQIVHEQRRRPPVRLKTELKRLMGKHRTDQRIDDGRKHAWTAAAFFIGETRWNSVQRATLSFEPHRPGNRTPGGERYRAVSGGDVSGKREGAGSLRIAAAQAAVK